MHWAMEVVTARAAAVSASLTLAQNWWIIASGCDVLAFGNGTLGGSNVGRNLSQRQSNAPPYCVPASIGRLQNSK